MHFIVDEHLSCFTFWLLKIMLPRIILYMSFDKHIYALLLGIVLKVELLIYRVCISSFDEIMPRNFPKLYQYTSTLAISRNAIYPYL